MFFAAVDTAGLHLIGPPRVPAFTDLSLAVTAIALGGLRYNESGDVMSLSRGLAMSCGVLLIAFELCMDALFLK